MKLSEFGLFATLIVKKPSFPVNVSIDTSPNFLILTYFKGSIRVPMKNVMMIYLTELLT